MNGSSGELAVPLFSRTLLSFIVVAEELHFGRAAERLHISQPPLSQQIRRLERELEVILFTRSTRTVQLTPAGRLLLAKAHQLVDQGSAAVQEARRVASGALGSLSVGFTSTAAYQVLPKAIAEYRRAFPDVTLTLHEGNSQELWEWIEAGRIDLGLLRRNGSMRNPTIEFALAGREPMLLAMPASHPLARKARISLAALGDVPFVGFSAHASSYFHALLRSLFSEAGVEPRVMQESVMPTILALVEAEVGLALVPASAAGLRAGRLAYRPIHGRGSGVRALLHSVRRNDGSSPPAEVFAAVLSKVARLPPARYAPGEKVSRSAASRSRR